MPVLRHAEPPSLQPMEAAMERFIHQANIEHYRRLIAEREGDSNRDDCSDIA